MGTWSESEVEVAGGRLHVYRRGRGRPVILAHGATDNGRCWERVAAALADDFALVAYDARGHGRSTGAVEGTSSGADLVAVAESLDLEDPAAVGHSMGAGAVSEALTLRPDLFAAGVLEDPAWGDRPAAGTSAERRERLRTFTGWVESLQELSLDEVIAKGREQNPQWHDDDLPAWAESKLQYRPAASGGGAGRPDWKAQVAAFACPVLLVCGAPGRALVSPETAAAARALNPRLDVVQLDAGHNIRREAYDGYVEAVRSFLLTHLGARRSAPTA